MKFSCVLIFFLYIFALLLCLPILSPTTIECINREEPPGVTVRRRRNRTVGSISAGRWLRVRALRDRKQETPHKENKQPKYIPNAVRGLTTLFHHRSYNVFRCFFFFFTYMFESTCAHVSETRATGKRRVAAAEAAVCVHK